MNLRSLRCLLSCVFLLAYGGLPLLAADPALTQWKEDFSDPVSFQKNWIPYGRLADGQWAQGAKARPEWWQIVDGALRGQNFPEEKHSTGTSRHIAGTDIQVRCRIKIATESLGSIRIFGRTLGDHPPEKKDNHVTVVQLFATGIKAWNGDFNQAAQLAVAPDVWHELVIEMRGRQVRTLLDEKEVLNFTLPLDQPKESLSLEANGDKKAIGVVWFDDVVLEPLEQHAAQP